MYAVIKTGGKQYRVKPDDVLEIERLPGEAGDMIEFSQVLMVAGESGIEVGTPVIADAIVAAELIEQTRGDKIKVFKKKRRKHYRRTMGHRQDLSQIRITEILTGGAKPKAKAAAKQDEAKQAEPEATKKPGAARQPSAVEEQQVAGPADDLTLIGGVGPKLKERLGEAGITSLAEIAALSEEEAEKLDAELDLKGRIAREDWVGQAKQILGGGGPKKQADGPAGASE